MNLRDRIRIRGREREASKKKRIEKNIGSYHLLNNDIKN